MRRIIFIMLILAAGVLIFRVFTKEAISAEEFTLQMEAKGYTVRNIYDPNKVTSLYAEHGDFSVSFMVYETIREATSSYGIMRGFIRGRPDLSYREIHGVNFDKITGTARGVLGHFRVLVRVDNTILFIATNMENRATAEALLNTLGY